ncbi:hypothetical protein EDF81_2398 [Enterobacter sp. BIGb0383]|nr:hypothetical protein EDF81_2398 [Enterobacter sp. BIGb0383]ROS08947.1 hypothetical protein EC848_2441 [Enterobacter sp. BIGb0359]
MFFISRVVCLFIWSIWSMLSVGLVWPEVSFASDVAVVGVRANGHFFDKDDGFPETAFKNASFTIQLTAGVNPSEFNWSSSEDWVSVSQVGDVTFGDKPSEYQGPVTITASSKSDDTVLYYKFYLRYWFAYAGKEQYKISSAENYCSNIGYTLSPYKKLTPAEVNETGKRNVGSLWGEWGDVKIYGWDTSITYWTNDNGPQGYHYLVNLVNGFLYDDYKVGQDRGSVHVACIKKIQPQLDVTANGYTFNVNDGFPTTAFKNAEFKINVNDNGGSDKYIFTSNRTWVDVDGNGVVTIIDEPGRGEADASIKIVSTSDGGNLTYSFKIAHWFVSAGVNRYTISNATGVCNKMGFALPPYEIITNAGVNKSGHRDVGTLWGEWGNVKAYGWGTDITYWANDIGPEGYHYLTSLENGYLYNDYQVGYDRGSVYVACSASM